MNEEDKSAVRQALHSVRIALRRIQECLVEGSLSTPMDHERWAVVLRKAEVHLSEVEARNARIPF